MTRIVRLKRGDRVVYRKPEVSSHPGRNAVKVCPSKHGKDYVYAVNKYWIVEREINDRTVEVRTHHGKIRRIQRADPRLRRTQLLERLFLASRFPELPDQQKTGMQYMSLSWSDTELRVSE